jgi:DNA invertase Pin-like site-specific DNA recombinase
MKVASMNGKFVSYIRVSTKKQGQSGLGLEAQRESITGYLNGGRWTLIGEYIEVESGKRSDRPELAKALSVCRLHKATLLIAKLDRLARNVAFVSALMEAGVKFVCVDMPQANELTVHIMAAMAEYEAKAISARTSAALKAAKARGVRLGGLRDNSSVIGKRGRKASIAARREAAAKYRADVLPEIRAIQARGPASLREIADTLNASQTPAPRGGEWSAAQVLRILKTERAA